MNSKIFCSFFILMSYASVTFSQTNDYKCCIKNIRNVNPATIEFDIFIESSGKNKQKLTAMQGGINFNYEAIADGGTITGTFKQGSADPLLPRTQQSPRWNINPQSKQIRLLAAIAHDSIAVVIQSTPGMRIGTFVMTNTVPFKKEVIPDFTWLFKTGSGSTSKTQLTTYVNGATITKDITVPENHCVKK